MDFKFYINTILEFLPNLISETELQFERIIKLLN